MLSDVPLMAYLGWNWIPFPNGLLIACFWFYRLLQLTRSSSSSSSDRGARTCDLPARTSARSPLRAAGWPDTIPSISGEPWAGLAPNSLPSHGIFWSCTPPFSQFLEGDHVRWALASSMHIPGMWQGSRKYFLCSVRAGGQTEGGFPTVGCQQFADAVLKSN